MKSKITRRVGNSAKAFALALTFGFAGTAGAATIQVAVDESSSYGPTKIINGDFKTEPTYAVNPQHGVNEGWNTTDPTGFEWAHPGGYGYGTYGLTKNELSSDDYFIEMNNHYNAVFSQDLSTVGGDVMRWTLAHGSRAVSQEQRIRAEIGAPNGPTSGTGDAVNANIKDAGKAIYRHSGVTHPAGVVYGYASQLGNLRLSSAASPTWYPVEGVYVIPEGQTVTRFAFIAEAPTAGLGNNLDTLTFSTLIGNLSAVANADGSVTVKGYWGDSDATKKLCIRIGTGVQQIDMAGVLNKNFTISIPAATIGDAAKIEVYHQDYEQAKRTIKVLHPQHHTAVASGETIQVYCTNTAHAVADSGCDHCGAANAVNVMLVARNAPYTAAPYDRAKVTGATDDLTAVGFPQPTITYAARGSAAFGTTAPTAAGLYTAKMTLGDVSVTADFEIMAIVAGAFEQVSSNLVKLPVTIEGSMTLYSIVPNGAKVRITAASGMAWKFQDAVKNVSSADATPVAGTDYLSITLVIDKSAVGTKTVAQVAEEALATLRYTRAVAEVTITGTYLGEGVTLKAGDYFLNGHFYTLSSGCQTWVNAMNWAFNLKNTDPARYPGYKSYPVTITSATENQLLVNIWNNAHPEYAKGTEVWLPSVPKNMTGGSVSIVESAGTWTVSVTGCPLATEDDGWTRANGCYGMGERYVWMTGVPEAGLPLPAETNAPSANGVYWSMTNPSNRGVNYFGHPNIGAVWDDLAPASYGGNAWTSFSSDGTFHMYGLAEWEPSDPETVVTAETTAKMVPVTFASVSEGTTRGGVAFSSTNTVRTVGLVGTIPALEKTDCTLLGWTTVSGGSSVVEKTSAEIAAIDPAIGSAAETWYAVWSDALTLGEFVPLTQRFPEAVGTTGNRYPQITIMLTREKGRSDETVTLPAVTGYTKNTKLSTDYSFVIDMSPAKTVAEIATNYLAKIRFLHVVNQEVRVVIGPTTGFKTFYNVDTKHYYQYVPFDWESRNALPWTTCYANAKGMTYAGRRGYLATVTSSQEDAFVYNAAKEVGWLGGTHMKPTTRNGQYYDGFTPSQSLDHWYWACGPECGEPFFDNQNANYTTYAGNVAKGYYFNWNNGEPNGGTGSENCLTTLTSGTGYSTGSMIPNYSWNDSSYNRNDAWAQYMPKGYFVEFGDRKVGDSTDDDPTVASASGYVIATADIVAPYVAFNAWGGYFPGAEAEIASNVCVDGVYALPPESSFSRAGYTFGGWFESWTNGAAQAVAGEAMFVQGPHMVYAKWNSNSSPVKPFDPAHPETGDGTLAFEPADGDGNGAVLKGATNVLEATDLAIPEFTSNGADGIPYVIIKSESFAYGNYDAKRVDAGRAEERLTSVTVSTYVTNIQSYAFEDCQTLTNVTFSKTRDYRTGAKAKLFIDDWAFKGSSVKTVTFPADSTVVLDYGAFADAKQLEHIYILGDVVVKTRNPFMGAGKTYFKTTGKPVEVHLSAKLASDPDYVAALTNGMSAARVVLNQTIEGGDKSATPCVTITSGPTVSGDEVTFSFTVSEASPWLKVDYDTVYLFWSTTLTADKTFIGNAPKHPKAGKLTKNADGSWTATFEKPATAGGTAAFFQLCIGD